MSMLASFVSQPPSQGALKTAAYMRIAALSFAAYEYVISCVSLPFIET
jgi:hypothetical protein